MAEKQVDCRAEVEFAFHFPHKGADQLQEVPSLSVFVFDDSGKFVGRWDEMTPDNITDNFTMALPLPVGRYRASVWGGLGDSGYYLSSSGRGHYNVLFPQAGQTPGDQFVLRMERVKMRFLDRTFDYVDRIPGALFFGDGGGFELCPGDDKRVDVDLVKYSKTIRLSVRGLPAGDYDIMLLASNGGYGVDGELAGDRARLWWPQREVAWDRTGTLTSTIHTLRPVFDNPHTLEIVYKATGEIFFSADLLADFIRKAVDPAGGYMYDTQEAVDEEDTFHVEIVFDNNSAYVGVTVRVNDYLVQSTQHVIR